MTERYAVLGHPVKHSKSPLIHAEFARQTGQDLSYTAEEVAPEHFETFLEDFFAAGGRGVNVTLPFKERAWARMALRSERAELAGAVNTVMTGEGGLFGDNTDGTGLVRDLTANNGLDLTGRSILILGAGGAVRGVLPSLLTEQPRRVVIANRTLSRAQDLAAHFSEQASRDTATGSLESLSFPGLEDAGSFDLIINGTSASLQGELPPLPDSLLAPASWCYDMMYSREATPFQHWASDRGAARALDGLGMLVEQAAESFRLWRAVEPETRPVITMLRESL